ncbi:DEAD/DEAH box helicase [Persephonella sp. KM09-Lau-8]|uniref:DEAD/DEAH box helicase n=1 Tax=Persephonella sp. KM09-Lau-8 TaxID=1158345 RepID=UPI00068AB5AE|nr:DEAD/DEAH box helicase [Persephonella sp. KM09-Lau-8]
MEVIEKKENKKLNINTESLYDWQLEALEKIWDRSAVLSAPTGAGKTKVAFLWMDIPNAGKSHRIIYTVPIKALANEKYRELSFLYGEEFVGIETGDIKKNQNAPMIVCTQEVYTRKYSKRKENLKVVIDEFHYIFVDHNRARAYIDGIRFSSPNHQILIMSATFGDAQAVVDYLNEISNKEFVLYETDFRPTELIFTENVYSIDTIPPHSIVYLFNITAISYLVKTVATYRKPLPVLKRRRISRLANSYKVNLEKFPELMRGVAQYHSRLTYTEKKFIEKLINEKYIDIVFSTNALGVGVNLPVENVIFASFKVPCGFKETRTLLKSEFLQLSGRAGRKGYFDTGYVSVLQHSFLRYETGSQIIETYRKLLEKEIEPPVVKLTLDVEKIVKEQTSIEKEIEYVTKYSFPKINKENVGPGAGKIKSILDNIDKETKSLLKEFFFPELSLEDNIKLVEFLKNQPVQTEVIALDYHETIKMQKIVIDALSLPVSSRDEIATLLLKRKIAKTLYGKQIKNISIEISGIYKIEETLRKMDPLLLIG